MEPSSVLTEFDMVIRLCLGFAAGTIIGFERSFRRQVAGLRTHILIAVGATLLMLLSIYLPQHYNPLKTSDPGRIAAQVVSGIGFLGAGAIIRLGNNIRGLTTAASLWFVAAVGLAIGSGMFLVAAVAEALGLFTLTLLSVIEKKIFPTERYKILEIYYKDTSPNTIVALDLLKEYKIKVQSIDISHGAKDKGTKMKILVRTPTSLDLAKVTKEIKAVGNIGKVEFKEKY